MIHGILVTLMKKSRDLPFIPPVFAYHLIFSWFEKNCTVQPGIGILSLTKAYLSDFALLKKWLFGNPATMCPILPMTGLWLRFVISKIGL